MQVAVVLALAGVAWIAIAFSAQDLHRDRRIERRDLAIGAGLFVIALAARWVLPVHALIHENHHGYEVDPLLPLDGDVARYGMVQGQLVLVKVFAYLAPRGVDPIFAFGALGSAMAVPGMYALGRQVFADRIAAWSAGVWLALLPIALFLAPTEEPLVAASGLCLAGVPLLWIGAREGMAAPIAAGTALVGLSACSRDVALPLAAMVPVTLLAASPEGGAVRWRPAAVATIALAACLAPFAYAVLAATRAQGGTPSFVQAPIVPFVSGDWIGWRAPFVPRWVGLAGIAGYAALAVEAVRRRSRGAMVVVALFVIAQTAGSVVRSSWFPSMLRHQLFAAVLLPLPIGWLFARLARRAEAPALRVAAWGFAPALGVVTLLAAPAGYRVDAPLTQEFRFLDAAVRALPAEARVVEIPRRPDLPDHIAAPFFWARRPGWEVVPRSDLDRLARRGSDRPVVLVLDRTCFLAPRCIHDSARCRPDEVRAEDRTEGTRYGRMLRECAEALGALPWVEVGRRTIVRREDRTFDLPSVDPQVTLAVLVWDGMAR